MFLVPIRPGIYTNTLSPTQHHIILTGSSGTTNAQSQDLHRNCAVALSAVNVCVIGEDVGHGLRSQIIGEHERHGGVFISSSCNVV